MAAALAYALLVFHAIGVHSVLFSMSHTLLLPVGVMPKNTWWSEVVASDLASSFVELTGGSVPGATPHSSFCMISGVGVLAPAAEIAPYHQR